jgi:hypothetical protein
MDRLTQHSERCIPMELQGPLILGMLRAAFHPELLKRSADKDYSICSSALRFEFRTVANNAY